MNPPLVLTIIIQPTGECFVNGPINDKALAFRMLDAATKAIEQHHLQQQNKIVIAGALPQIKPNGG